MRKRINNLTPFTYASPALILIAVLVIFPILYTMYISLTNLNLYHWKNYDFIGLQNYTRVLKGMNSQFYIVLLRTIIWTAANIALMFVFAMLLALLLNIKGLRFRAIFRALLILPWAIPSYISALVWKGMFNYDFGIVNSVLEQIGIGRIEWLTNPTNAMIACIIVNVWLSVPFMMIVCLGALQSVDSTYYEAAEIDGANWFQKFFGITMPLIMPVIMPAMILTSFVTFKQFDIIYLMTGGLAGNTDTVMTYAYNIAFKSNNHSLGAAFSVIIFLILLTLTIINMRRLKVTQASHINGE